MLKSTYTIFYKGGFVIYEKMITERKRLEEQILSVREKLGALPAGKLLLSHNEQHYKWYQSDGHQKVYIPKKNRRLAEELAVKKYLSLLLDELIDERNAVDSYLEHHHSHPEKESQLILNHPEFANLLSSYYTPLSQDLSEWSNAPYEHNSKFSEQLVHKSTSGNYVRSKSEAMIDTSLHMHQIPFRYECALQLGNTTIFPDFTIRHPANGKTYYWEHFGRMDDSHYAGNAFSKLQLYTSHGIIPNHQLITTYETKETPLSSELIEKIISHYFS